MLKRATEELDQTIRELESKFESLSAVIEAFERASDNLSPSFVRSALEHLEAERGIYEQELDDYYNLRRLHLGRSQC